MWLPRAGRGGRCEDLSEEVVEALRVGSVGVVPERDVEEAFGPEHDLAPIVIAGPMLGREDQSGRVGFGYVGVGGAPELHDPDLAGFRFGVEFVRPGRDREDVEQAAAGVVGWGLIESRPRSTSVSTFSTVRKDFGRSTPFSSIRNPAPAFDDEEPRVTRRRGGVDGFAGEFV